jgi:hypothetical protein
MNLTHLQLSKKYQNLLNDFISDINKQNKDIDYSKLKTYESKQELDYFVMSLISKASE